MTAGKKRKPHCTQPGELEIRIRPDGRVYCFAADELLRRALQAIAPADPNLSSARKGRKRGAGKK